MNEHFTNGMDYNALCAELRELREQKERLYFRDEALNRPNEPQSNRKRRRKRIRESTAIDPMILTQMLEDITPKTESSLFDDVLGILFLMIASFFFCYFIYMII